MEKITAVSLLEQKRQRKRITALTAYEAPFAKIMDDAGIDIILIGDSVGMTVLGREDTLTVTMEEIIHHSRAVSSAVTRALVVADMPFMSFQVSPEKALENAGRLIKEGGVHAVKLEGGTMVAETIRTITGAGIPVMAHLGLTPQSVHQLGGYKVQGKKYDSARQIIEDAKAIEEAGAFAVVLEAIPVDLAQEVTKKLTIPTIGIGAGLHCDGQILVMQDMLGISNRTPKFVKQYANIADNASKAFTAYIDEVRTGAFPSIEHSYVSQPKLKVVGEAKGKKKS